MWQCSLNKGFVGMPPNKKFVFMFPWVLKAKWIGSPTVSTLFYFYPVSEKQNPKTKFKLSRILHKLTISLQKLIQKLLHSINLTDRKAFPEGGKEGLWGRKHQRGRPPSRHQYCSCLARGNYTCVSVSGLHGELENLTSIVILYSLRSLGIGCLTLYKQTCLP